MAVDQITHQELQAQAQAMVNVLTAQRNDAQNHCLTLTGTVAILEVKLKAATDELAKLKNLPTMDAAP